MTWNEAQNYCYTQFRTSLASINSEIDHNESQLLCSFSNSGTDSCWIGDENVYQDFIGYTHNKTKCIVINEANINTSWTDTDCNAAKSAFLCNIPDELCDDTQWSVVDGDWEFGTNECGLYNANNGSIDDIELDLTGDLNTSTWKKIAIEHVFSLSANTPPNDYAMTGIMLNIKDYVGNDYAVFAGIRLNDTMAVIMLNGDLITMNNIARMNSKQYR